MYSAGLPVPARNTVAARIARMDPVEAGRRREGPDSVRPLQSAGGEAPVVDSILEQVQIDHTVIDLIVVDEHERQPIGRPYLTVAIDVCSRCILGMVVTLEAPSAVSVGLCLAHAAIDKRPWLEQLGVEARASPDDPALTEYWQQRRRRPPLPTPAAALGLA